MQTTKLIKRYNNRKLYSLESSSYITLNDVFDYVQSGQPIQVVNNGDQADLTQATVISALVEQTKDLNTVDASALLIKTATYLTTIKGVTNAITK